MADGFSISFQASRTHYCEPRDDEGPYVSVEAGFPSEHEPLLRRTDDHGVWARIPSQVVAEIIEKHGGLIEGDVPPLANFRKVVFLREMKGE
jgi:hypothetical protein